MSTINHAAGPIVQIYLMQEKVEKRIMVGTLLLYFLLINTAKVIPYLLLGLGEGGKAIINVDTLHNYSAFGAVASAVYFIGDLSVGAAYAEPMMSVWVDEDVAAAKEELRQHVPECLVTGGSDFLMTPFLLGLYGVYTEFQTSGPVGATVYCRKTD